MKQYITPFDIANQIRMMRPVFDGAVMVVEGDSDARVYKRFVDDECRVIPAHGKSNALNAMELLDESGHDGVLAVVDNDFWRLDEIEPSGDNVFVTDTHDLETMIVASSAFDAVMVEFASDRRLRRFGGDIRKMIFGVAMPVGFVRWISSSKQDNLSLRFKDVPFSSFIVTDEKGMKIDLDAFLIEVRRKTRHSSFDLRELKQRVRRLMKGDSYDPLQVCRGHDVVRILTYGLQHVFGNRHAKSISYEQVDRILRLSFGWAEFMATELYSTIIAWEKRNEKYRVLIQMNHRKNGD